MGYDISVEYVHGLLHICFFIQFLFFVLLQQHSFHSTSPPAKHPITSQGLGLASTGNFSYFIYLRQRTVNGSCSIQAKYYILSSQLINCSFSIYRNTQ